MAQANTNANTTDAPLTREDALLQLQRIIGTLAGKDAKSKRTARVAVARAYLQIVDGEDCILASFTVKGESGATMPFALWAGTLLGFSSAGRFKAASAV